MKDQIQLMYKLSQSHKVFVWCSFSFTGHHPETSNITIIIIIVIVVLIILGLALILGGIFYLCKKRRNDGEDLFVLYILDVQGRQFNAFLWF